LNGSPDKTNCNGKDFNLDLYVKGTDGKYTAHTESCVIGNNLNWMSESDTVESCQAKCDAQDDCLAIEFGVAYGGLKKGTKSTGDCTNTDDNHYDDSTGDHGPDPGSDVRKLSTAGGDQDGNKETTTGKEATTATSPGACKAVGTSL
jgi:hypothetical protein